MRRTSFGLTVSAGRRGGRSPRRLTGGLGDDRRHRDFDVRNDRKEGMIAMLGGAYGEISVQFVIMK
jgi:hypothetical protein